MLDKQIIELLKPIRLKYFIKKLIKYLSFALLVWSVSSLILMLISKVVPITFVWQKITYPILLYILISIGWTIYKRPSLKDTAYLIDSFGLKERIITSLELKDQNSSISKLQKNDTIDGLKKNNFKEKISLVPPFKPLLIMLILVLATVIVGFIPSKTYYRAKEIEENKGKIEKTVEDIKKVEEKIAKDKILTELDKKEIENKLNELKKKLKKASTPEEMNKEISKTKKKLENLLEELKKEKIDELVEKLSKEDMTKEISKALENKSQEEIKKAMDDMAKKLENMSKEDLEKLAEKLKKLAEELKKNPELAKKLQELAESISQNTNGNGNNAAINQSLANLGELLNGMISNTPMTGSVEDLLEQLEQLNLNFGDGDSDGQENGNGNGNGNGKGNGNGQGQGQGNGYGQGTGGGAGDGTSPGSEDNGTGGTGGGSKDSSDKEVKDYEKIFTPQNLDTDGYSTQIHDDVDKDGEKDIIQIKKFGDLPGESIPYNEVLKTYRENAYRKLGNEEIPENMKETVKRYFSELE